MRTSRVGGVCVSMVADVFAVYRCIGGISCDSCFASATISFRDHNAGRYSAAASSLYILSEAVAVTVLLWVSSVES